MTNNSLSLEQLENVEKTTLNHYNDCMSSKHFGLLAA